jgi:ferritin-like metal-binding protein YciE
MAEMTTLYDALVEEMKDMYHAEKQLVKALPKMVKGATSPDLRQALESHFEETQNHVTRLERAFAMLDETASAKHCAGMAGIIEEGAGLLKEGAEEPVMDALIIASAQRAEHYEIGAYGTICAWAKALEFDGVAQLLHETLNEEKAADQKLTTLAKEGINDAASAGAEDREDDTDQDDEEAESERAPSSMSHHGASPERSPSRSRKRERNH